MPVRSLDRDRDPRTFAVIVDLREESHFIVYGGGGVEDAEGGGSGRVSERSLVQFSRNYTDGLLARARFDPGAGKGRMSAGASPSASSLLSSLIRIVKVTSDNFDDVGGSG